MSEIKFEEIQKLRRVTFLQEPDKFQNWLSSTCDYKFSEDIVILLNFLAMETLAILCRMIWHVIFGQSKKLPFSANNCVVISSKSATKTILDSGAWFDNQLTNPNFITSYYYLSFSRDILDLSVSHIYEAVRRLQPTVVSLRY